MSVTAWRRLMPYTVIVETCSTMDSYGARTYQSCASYPCAIQGPSKFLHQTTQQERISSQTVYVGSTAPITTQDRITLPSSFEIRQPGILQVQRVSDQWGTHHVKVFCG